MPCEAMAHSTKSRYEVIRALAVDSAELALFKVVDKEYIPYPQSFSILVMIVRCRL
jgi:hypothetical protein